MLKLVSNKGGVETHQLEISENGFTIEPSFEGVQELLQGLIDKQQILNALSQFNPEYVWAVTYETPPVKPLTRRQFRLAIVTNGYNLADIEALIAQNEDDTQRQIIQIEWQDATVFERTNPTLLMMSRMLGLTSQDVDALWEYGLAL